MATAAIKNHILPKLTRNKDDNEGRPNAAQDASKRENEKQFIVHWEEEQRPLEPEEITIDHKRLGHSSNYLRPEDFQLLKTLGTGMGCDPRRRRPQC